MPEYRSAQEIALRKYKSFVPKFHQHIAAGKLRGQPCKVGDRVVGYDVVKTVPEGTVLVTEDTVIRYE